MEKKLSAYQKLKAENRKLKSDLYQIIQKPGDIETKYIIMSYKAVFILENALWAGDAVVSTKGTKGILNKIK